MTAEQKITKERELLEKLVDLGNKFRNTPIVDDDFCVQRDNFDNCLDEAAAYLKENKKVTVVKQSMWIDGCMGMQECVTTSIQ